MLTWKEMEVRGRKWREMNERKPQHPEEGSCAAARNMQPEEEAGQGLQDIRFRFRELGHVLGNA
jgi:hypothetical protein